MHLKPLRSGAVVAGLILFGSGLVQGAPALGLDQQEEFLAKAKIVKVKEAKKGVTGTLRVTLSDGTTTHDASVQTIDERRPGTYLGEVNFKDTYKFNVAGWRLAKLLGLDDMVPPSIERRYEGKAASYTWWIDDVKMDEVERKAKNIQAPDQETWKMENAILQVFDQLIYNMDRNQTNMLIDGQWHLWMIDHGRGFRRQTSLKNPAALSRIDRDLLAKLKALDKANLQKELKSFAEPGEIDGLMARRDLIVKFFDAKGDSALFDRPRKN